MKKALVVDDEEILREYFKTLLIELGFKVFTADDGDTAIRTMEENPDTDLIVLDLIMRRMGGREALPRLKAIRPDVKVIIASACIEPEDEDELLRNMGVDAVMRKPFTMFQFNETVARVAGS